MLRGLLDAYLSSLRRQPFITKSVASFTIFGCSDSVCQLAVEKKRSLDPNRLLSRAASGVLVVCWVHPWWGFLEPRAERIFSFATAPWKNTLLKVFADQTIGAGSINVMYLTHVALCDGKGVDGAIESLKTQLLPLLLAHWSVFPAFHTLNFRYVPLQHRVLAQNGIQVGWSGFLSYRFRPTEEAEPVVDRIVRTASGKLVPSQSAS